MEFYYTSQDPAEIARQVFERLQVCDSNSSQSSCYGDYKRSTSVARPPDGSAHRPFRRYGSPLARDDSKPFVESKSSSVKSNKIPPPNLDLYEEGIPVIIGEVNTLNNFYLIINSIDLEFEELNDEMASFYVNRESCTNVQVDGFYAAKDPDGGNWCRVQVIYKSDTVYTCFFVDYGATKCVPLDALYTLEESFIKQPQRSFKASLEDVKSESGFWPHGIINAFLDSCRDQEMMAFISTDDSSVKQIILVTDDHNINEKMLLLTSK